MSSATNCGGERMMIIYDYGGGGDVAIFSLQVKSFVTFLESRRAGGSGRLFSTVHCEAGGGGCCAL